MKDRFMVSIASLPPSGTASYPGHDLGRGMVFDAMSDQAPRMAIRQNETVKLQRVYNLGYQRSTQREHTSCSSA